MKINEFKNGNINFSFECEDLEKIEKNNVRDVLASFLTAIDWKDCYMIGDEFCLSNYDMGVMLYNVRRDFIYIVSLSELLTAAETKKAVKLYARKPDQYDREEIEKQFA